MERKDVFISFKSQEFDEAQQLKTVLEKNGISCWLAPDMLTNGLEYITTVPKAIRECKVFVLVLSKSAQKSIWIPKELCHALTHQKAIFPVMVEDCDILGSFDFLLTKVKRFEIFNNKQEALENLVEDIKNVISALPDEKNKSIKKAYNEISLSFKRKTLYIKGKLKYFIAKLLRFTPYGNLPKKSPVRLPLGIVSLSSLFTFFLVYSRYMDEIDSGVISLLFSTFCASAMWYVGWLFCKLIVKIPQDVKEKIFYIITTVVLSIILASLTFSLSVYLYLLISNNSYL